MLILRKPSAINSSITIMMRDKEPYFTPALQIGFAIAISLHVFFIFLFHIVLFKPPVTTFIFPPIAVEAPLHQDGILLSATEETPDIYLSLPKRPPTVSHFLSPKFVDQNQLTNSFVISDKRSILNQLDTVSQIVTQLDLHTNEFGPFKEKPLSTIKLVVSGSLQDKLSSINLAPIVLPQNVSVAYAVIVENKTGHIIWFEQTAVHQELEFSDLMLKNYMVNSLKNMHFNVSKDAFITHGIIEFHFFASKEL